MCVCVLFPLTVVAALVCEVLCCGECDTWGDDTLDGGVVCQVEEENGLLKGAVLLEILWSGKGERAAWLKLVATRL